MRSERSRTKPGAARGRSRLAGPAVARFELAFKVVARGTKLQHLGWNTDLFERRGGRWQLLWSQTTPVPNNIAFLIKALQPAH